MRPAGAGSACLRAPQGEARGFADSWLCPSRNWAQCRSCSSHSWSGADDGEQLQRQPLPVQQPRGFLTPSTIRPARRVAMGWCRLRSVLDTSAVALSDETGCASKPAAAPSGEQRPGRRMLACRNVRRQGRRPSGSRNYRLRSRRLGAAGGGDRCKPRMAHRSDG